MVYSTDMLDKEKQFFKYIILKYISFESILFKLKNTMYMALSTLFMSLPDILKHIQTQII